MHSALHSVLCIIISASSLSEITSRFPALVKNLTTPPKLSCWCAEGRECKSRQTPECHPENKMFETEFEFAGIGCVIVGSRLIDQTFTAPWMRDQSDNTTTQPVSNPQSRLGYTDSGSMVQRHRFDKYRWYGGGQIAQMFKDFENSCHFRYQST